MSLFAWIILLTTSLWRLFLCRTLANNANNGQTLLIITLQHLGCLFRAHPELCHCVKAILVTNSLILCILASKSWVQQGFLHCEGQTRNTAMRMSCCVCLANYQAHRAAFKIGKVALSPQSKCDSLPKDAISTGRIIWKSTDCLWCFLLLPFGIFLALESKLHS